MRDSFLQFSPPYIGEEEVAEVVDTLRSGWITTGPKTKRFEAEFAAHLQAPAALALNSCTAAMHTALATYGVGPGDEVITSTVTFAATANVIEHVGARPVLVDVQADTFNMDPAAVERALSPRTRAIMPVHFAGHPVDLDEVEAFAKARDLLVIEDAAHALPASYRGRTIGSGDNPVAFSFYATKNLTTGEGGMLTGNLDMIDRARVVSLHGMSRDAWRRYEASGTWYYEVVRPGFKYNMTDVQASMGLCQLEKLTRMQQRRRAIVLRYDAAFGDVDALQIPARRDYVDHAWHLYVLRLRLEALTLDRARFIDELKALNIGTSVHFIPLHLHPHYRDKYGLEGAAFPVSSAEYPRCVSLPLHPGLSDQDVDDVIEAVRDVVTRFRR